MAVDRVCAPVRRIAAPPALAVQFLPRPRRLRAGGTPRFPPPSSNRRARLPGRQIRSCVGNPASPPPSCAKFLVPARAPHPLWEEAARRRASASASCRSPFRRAKSWSPAAARETTHLEKHRLHRNQCERPRIGLLDRNRREL